QVAIAIWQDDARGPFMRRQGIAAPVDVEPGVEIGQRHRAVSRGMKRRRQQAVIAAGARPGDGAHRIAADAVRDEPLPAECGFEVAGDFTTKLDHWLSPINALVSDKRPPALTALTSVVRAGCINSDRGRAAPLQSGGTSYCGCVLTTELSPLNGFGS